MRVEIDLRTEVALDGVTVVLARWQDRDHLRDLVEQAVATTGKFVDVETADGQHLSWLITPRSRMTISTFEFEREPVRGGTIVLDDGEFWDMA